MGRVIRIAVLAVVASTRLLAECWVAPLAPPRAAARARGPHARRGVARRMAAQPEPSRLRQLRRAVYEAVLPLDQGDFRWEFLVPWTNKTLTTADKAIVGSTFVGVALAIQTAFDNEASTGVHLAYIAQFFSYAIGNPVGYRAIALVSSLFEILGDLVEQIPSSANALPVVYNALFIPINLYYVLRWAIGREEQAAAAGLDAEEEELFDRCFAPLGFSRSQFARLLRRASFETSPRGGDGTTLCVEGSPLRELFVVSEGGADVVVGGTVTTTIPPFQVIGEASLLENLQSDGGVYHQPSRATIVAPPGARYVRWSQRAFFELQTSDRDFAYTIQLMIARTLSHKLNSARNSQKRTLEATGARADATAQLLDNDETDLYLRVFKPSGVTPAQFRRLLPLARFADVAADGAGTVLARAGEPWTSLVLPLRGRVEGVSASSGLAMVSHPVLAPVDATSSLQNLFVLGLAGSEDGDKQAAPVRGAADEAEAAASGQLAAAPLDVVARAGARYVVWQLSDVVPLMRVDAAFAGAVQRVFFDSTGRVRAPALASADEAEDTVDLAEYGVGLI